MVSAAGSMHPANEGPVLEELDEAECFRLLAGAKVGRVGVTIGAMPAVFPINYAMLGRTVVFRAASGTKLESAADDTVVAFEIDDIDEAAGTGWSVLVVGVAKQLTGAEREAAMALPLEQWAPVELEHIFGVAPDVVTGRRLLAPRA
jgi:nitroimidazol reductase NimA-like FMN-containing flavoprotein (pyridoxamine 5'-phosphate oxidase superfamily)